MRAPWAVLGLCVGLSSAAAFSSLGPNPTRIASVHEKSRRNVPTPFSESTTCHQGRNVDISLKNLPVGDQETQGDKDRAKLIGVLVLLSVPLSWGTYVPVVRYLYAIQPPVPGFVFSACYYALAALTTSSLAFYQQRTRDSDSSQQNTPIKQGLPIRGGLELGCYLFIANCLQVIGLRTVESDRAGFLVQLTTVLVPFAEALFARNLSTVPIRTWFACMFAFVGLFVMGLDGRVVTEPVAAFSAALSSFTQGDLLIIGAAVLYTLHVVRLGTYAKQTTPMQLAASKATVETILSVLLCLSLVATSTAFGEAAGLLGFAASTGKEITTFFSSFGKGLADGSITGSSLVPAIGAVFWTGWVTCAYTIYAQSFGQARVTPTSANLIYTFQPIFTALFAWVLLGETMGPAGFVGGAIIAASVYVVASASFNKRSSEKSVKNSGYPTENAQVLDQTSYTLVGRSGNQTQDLLNSESNR